MTRSAIRSKPAVAVVVLLVAAAVVAAGCSNSADRSNGPDSTTTAATATTAASGKSPDASSRLLVTSPIGTFRVERQEVTFVDDTRPTKAHGGRPEIPQRTLPTVVWYPAGAKGALEGEGQVPLIVFSHGSTRNADDYASTLSAWASAGYVVAAPNFPLSTTGVPGGTDYGGAPEQAGDVSFVIDRMLDTSTTSTTSDQYPWTGRIDLGRIGLGGQSFGAITTLTAAADPCCRDERIKAITEFAGFGGGSDRTKGQHSSPPALFVSGTEDPTISYDAGHGAFEAYPGDAWFLTLVGTGHDDGYFDGTKDPLSSLVTKVTLSFYDLHLKDDQSAASRIESLVADAGPKVAKLTQTR